MELNVNTITTLLTTVGFPIFCCIILFKMLMKQIEESKALKESIDNNTAIIARLLDKLE